MTLYQFNELDINDRAELVWSKGEFLERSIDGDKRYNLYHIYAFYVEVVMDGATTNIEDVAGFIRGNRLDKYVSRVDVSKLLNE